ncbi:MAG: hypothetical protein PHG07_01400 [Lachnospiraceae bacterium]|nr:hypothetical protein [Lachnospiraceae bacterium]
MRLILKLIALPLLLTVVLICLLGKFMMNTSSYVIGALLLVIGGCGIYCVFTANWKSLAILAVMGLAAFLLLFVAVWAVVTVEGIRDRLGEFIRS